MLNKLRKSDFIKNSSILIIGTVVAQIIPIMIQPIIRRTYTDAETGQLDLYMSFVAILASFAHLNYSNAIVIPKSEKSAMNLLGGAIISSFSISLLLFIIFFIFDSHIINLLNLPISFTPWLKYIPLSIFLIGSYTSMTSWLTRVKKFKAIAINKFSRRSGEAFIQITGKNLSTNGLIIGAIFGDLINFISNIYQISKTSFKLNLISLSKIKTEFKTFKEFPIYSLLPSLLNTLSSNLPIIMITSFFSVKIAGQFGLSRMVLAIPIALISVSLSQVLIQSIAEKRQKKESIKDLMRNLFIFLMIISTVGTLIIYFGAPRIFSIAFGAKWKLASEMSQVLIFYYSVSFVATSISVVFIALEEIKINSAWQTSHFILILSLFFFKGNSIMSFITVFTIFNIISYLIYLLLAYYVIKKYTASITN
jgi:O-antigen/teichoic acid export membrane protein